MHRAAIIVGALALGCGEVSWVHLQIADRDPPFLEANVDFDALRLVAMRDGCATIDAALGAAPLPATLTIEPGECYRPGFTLQVEALQGASPVARSGWVPAAPAPGGAVVTATLTDVPAPRLVLEADLVTDRTLDVVLASGAEDVSATVAMGAATFAATATAAGARGLARLTTANVVIRAGDALVVAFEVGAASTVQTLGFELELSTGASAMALALADADGRPIHPGASAGREPGLRQLWTVDLSAAAGARLVGVLFGMDTRTGGGLGAGSLVVHQLGVVR